LSACRRPGFHRSLNQNSIAMFLESKIIRAVVLLALPISAWGQVGTQFYFANPSFEGDPGAGIDIPGWYNCGPGSESPPDLQPGFFGVRTPARNGSTYLGLVVRQTGTWESVGQRLSQPLAANQCYEFSLDLRRDTSYESPLGKSLDPRAVRFTTPVKVIIWGGNGFCHKGEVLYQSSAIIHPRWLTYNCRISPKKGTWSHIIIEAYYNSNDPFNPTLPIYANGNVLIDNASPIKQVVCGPEKMPEPGKRPALTKKGPDKPTTVVTAKPSPVVTETPKRAKRGKTFRLDVYFKANEYTFDLGTSEKSLEELYSLLKNNSDVSVEIGGHTNNLLYPNEARALELSTNRAKSVAEWLMSKGVSANRVNYKGYGWTKPVEPNTSPEGRRRNQRVEVTILTYY
jgi:outer membrane protein OmpA-like peptidoglycan-associated protein